MRILPLDKYWAAAVRNTALKVNHEHHFNLQF